MKLKLEITMDNAAFFDDDADDYDTLGPAAGRECARILRRLADRLDDETPTDGDGSKLVDINGNAVGTWEVVA